MKVYILISVVDYEGSDIVGVWADEAKAEEARQQIIDHNAKKPQWVINPTDEEYEDYRRREKEWNESEPYHGHSSRDNYYVAPYDVL